MLNTKVTVIKIKNLQYLNKIRPYLKDIINKLKKSDSWKIQLTIALFLPKMYVMHVMHNMQHVIHVDHVMHS